MGEVLTLQLRFERATASDQAYVAPTGVVEYLIGGEDDLFNARLDWDAALIADLLAVGQPGALEAGRRVGQRLRALLPPQVRERLDGLLSEAALLGRPAYLTLRSSAAEIYALPWELLLVNLREGPTDQPLGLLPNALLRYCWPRSRSAPLRVDPAAADGRPDPRLAAGRVLFAWSDAGGAVPAEAHRAALLGSGGSLMAERPPVELERVSFGRLAEALERSRTRAPISALHLLCHGVRRGTATELLFQGDGPGVTDRVDAERLRNLLAGYADTLRLVVLCACHGGDAGAAGAAPLGSLAQELHKAGLACVVASRLPLSRPGSVKVAEALWRGLLGGPGSLEESFLAARGALATSPESTDRATLQLYTRPEDGVDSRPITFRPFRGLRPFNEESSAFFHGRDAERDELARRVEEAAGRESTRLVLVAGASGSGKTSLLLGGVGPVLRGRSPPWELAVLRPVHPGGAALGLWQALRAFRRRREPLPRGVAEPPPPSPMSAAAVRAEAMDLRTADPACRVLVVADGFEEVLTTLSAPERRADRDAFVRALWDLARQPGLGVVVAISMRLEYLARTGEIVLDEQDRRLDRFAFDPAHSVLVRELDRGALTTLIERPARRVGLELESGLVDRLLQDLGPGTSALPLLQYVLDELWHLREGNRRLSLAAYQALGGLQGALARTADELFDSLEPEARAQARRLLVRMVWVGEDGSRTRRRVNPRELRPADPGRAAAFDAALEAFAARRLVVRGDEAPSDPDAGDWAELAHEALLRGWERLRGWVVEDEAILRQIAKVTALFDLWRERSGGPDAPGFLLRGADLGYAMKVLADYGTELAGPVVAFIEESRLAELAEQRRKRLGAWLVAGLALAVALGMTVVAGVIQSWRHEAELARDKAVALQEIADRSRERAELSAQEARDAQSATLDALRERDAEAAAAELARDAEAAAARRALFAAAQARDARDAEQVQAERARDAARLSAARLVREEDPTLAAILLSEVGEPQLLPGWREEVLRTLGAPIAAEIRGLVPGGLRAARLDGEARVGLLQDLEGGLFALRNGQLRTQPGDPGGEVLAVARDAEAILLLVRRGAREVAVLGLEDRGLVERERIVAEDDITAAAFRSDGSVVTGSQIGVVRVWSRGRGVVIADKPARLVQTIDPIAGSADVLVSTRDGAVYRVGAGGSTALLTDRKQTLRAVSIDRGGAWLALAPVQGAAEIYALGGSTPTRYATLAAVEGGVVELGFSDDGTLLTLSGRGELRRWPWPRGTDALRGRVDPGPVRANATGFLTLGERGLRLHTFGRDGSLVDTGLRVNAVSAADMDASATRVVAVNAEGRLVLYRREDKVWRSEALAAPPTADPRVVGVRISPDGQAVVAWAPVGTGLWLWSAAAGWSTAPVPLNAPGVASERILRDLAIGGGVIVAAESGGLRLWSLPERPAGPLELRGGAPERAERVGVYADGALVLVESEGGTARLWSPEAGTLRTLGSFGAELVAARLLNDGRVVGATSTGAFVQDGEGLVRIPVPGGASAIVEGGGGLWVIGVDGAVWRWPTDLSVEALGVLLAPVATACIPPETRRSLTGETGSLCR